VTPPSTLNEACERLAGWVHVTARDPGDIITSADGEYLLRSDLVAVLAHCGWNVTAEQARLDFEPAPMDQPMLGGES
jgi:hypothetical protein